MKSTLFKSSLLTVALAASGLAHSDALIGPNLTEALTSGESTYKVIVTGKDKAGVSALMQELQVPYLALQTMPMVGATLTKSQIEALAENPNVKSIYQDVPLEYYNYTSGEITGGHIVHDTLGLTGNGVTVAVLDSGVDATHPDLQLGETTVENVKIVGDLDLLGGINVFVEKVPNSDTSSGHGTHVAGTVAGTGEASKDDSRRAYAEDGIAPEAGIVGLGAGEGISILYGLLGFDYAIANQDRLSIDVITNSWGGGDGANFDPNNPINVASYEAYRNGMVVSFAASNSGPEENTLNQYAIAPWVINVAAGTSEKLLADFSSRGVADVQYKQPDITAPGQSITSTRAPNTAIGAMGPVIDLNNPSYALYYHTISGTSMATPFIAGVAALMLEANPDLSPDQIESIMMETAEPMPDYQPHEVGAGYIDVPAAIQLAMETTGNMRAFMDGDTVWSSKGEWTTIDNNDEKLNYEGTWRELAIKDAYEGSIEIGTSTSSSVSTVVNGDRVRFTIVTRRKSPGTVEFYVDGKLVEREVVHVPGTDKFNPGFVTFTLDNIGEGAHNVELVTRSRNIALDRIEVDGSFLSNDVVFSERTQSDEGLMGPSAENLEVQELPLEIQAGDTKIESTLSWDAVADLDFYLVNPNGEEVASSASLANPESLAFEPTMAGTYLLRVTGFISVATPFSIETTVTSASNN